jgi:hypothetical protein
MNIIFVNIFYDFIIKFIGEYIIRLISLLMYKNKNKCTNCTFIIISIKLRHAACLT